MRDEPLAVEFLGHHVARADQRGLFHAVGLHPVPHHFGDMDDGNADLRLHLLIDAVHGIGANEQAFRARLLQPAGRRDQLGGGGVPVRLALASCDGREVQAVDQ